MKRQKILNLLNESSNSKCVTKKQNIFNNQSNRNCDTRNGIIYKTEVLTINLCDHNGACILVRGNTTIVGNVEPGVAFKNCALFTKSIVKIDGKSIDDAEDLDFVLPLYKLLE